MPKDFLMHYGRSIDDIPKPPGRGSGRYPKGSGENPKQHPKDFIDQVEFYRSQGKSNKQIAEILMVRDKRGKFTDKALRNREQIYKEKIKTEKIAKAMELYHDPNNPKGTTEIGRILGEPEPTVRGWIKKNGERKVKATEETANVLRKIVDEKGYVDVSAGAEQYLGVTQTRLDNAKDYLRSEGYNEYTVKIPQMNTGHYTTVTTMAAPDVTFGEVLANKFNIPPIYNDSRVLNDDSMVVDTGLYKERIHSISPDRIQIKYKEEGGVLSDGLVELRPGVKDITIGSNRYAQVRIPVDGTHYIKGMAIYNDNLPPGVDIRFNTNKHIGTPMINGSEGVLKPMKKDAKGDIDWENPFGASVTQLEYEDDKGKKAYSACNIVMKEGEWQKWDNNISSQLGSKQPVKMIERQLDLDLNYKKAEFETINNLTNPTIKKKLLIEFADKCDGDAAELHAAPFPGQQYHVFIPCPELKDGEVYAPNYKDGTVVAVVRHPHAGKFEIPVLTVRNTGSPAEKLIGPNAPDAICINHNTAQQLSGADFDGDSGPVIPLSDKARLATAKPIKELIDFDPSDAYPGYPGMKKMTSHEKGIEMGKVSNLLTDMQMQAADQDQIIRAVKHSMVVIDAEKHGLDWKRSEIDNGIAELKEIYQKDDQGRTGAATVVSRARADVDVPIRKDWRASNVSIDEEGRKIIREETKNNTYTEVKLKGEKVQYVDENGKVRSKTVFPAGDNSGWVGTYEDKAKGQLYYKQRNKTTGKLERIYLNDDDYTKTRDVQRTEKVKRMDTVDDAYELTSGGRTKSYPHEIIYANYANDCKALANLARRTWLDTKEYKKDPEASKEYADEVASLKAKLSVAKTHAPQERQALMMANRKLEQIKEANPDLDKEHEKKYKNQCMNRARQVLGVKRANTLIEITDKEWEAIQNKAVSPTVLSDILKNTNGDKLKERAMPRETKTISPTMEALAKSMAKSGYNNAQIAERLGCSKSSVYKILKGSNE